MSYSPTQPPPRPTRCPHCGTLAAEFVCHMCKKKRTEPLHRGQHDPFCIHHLMHPCMWRRFA